MNSHFIHNIWTSSDGPPLSSTNPATGERVWEGRGATAREVDAALAAAREALPSWASLSVEQRAGFLQAFADQLRQHELALAEAICRETGKPRWESREEVSAMINKVPISIQAHEQRRSPSRTETNGIAAAVRFKPHGVVAVFGPFNFPGHLPNGHIVPALLAGNTVVFKPSEMAPLVAQKTVELWQAAGLPAGVINMIQGGRETGILLANHPELDGLFFTGSFAAGQALHRAFAGHPGKILALEMGGNNPLVVWDIADADAAALIIVQSAYLTAGQRCTCARRLIVPQGADGERILDRLATLIPRLRVGPYTAEPEPFMGPVISDAAADSLLTAQDELKHRGGVALIEMKSLGPRRAMLSPGLMDVTAVADPPDVELFGPFLQVVRVANFESALIEANRTAYGLAAGLLSDRADLYERFLSVIRAGVVNWNRPTTGASSRLPFGGVGHSGNHRPSGAWATDYCSYPIASMESPTLTLAKLPPGITP